MKEAEAFFVRCTDPSHMAGKTGSKIYIQSCAYSIHGMINVIVFLFKEAG